MTGEPTHATSEMAPRAPAMLIIVCKVKYQLRFIVSYVQPVTQHFELRTVQKAPLQSQHNNRNGAAHPSYINYCPDESKVSTMIRCWLFLIRYTAVRIKNRSKSTSANKIATMKNTDNFHYKGKPSRATTKSTLFAISKENGTQRKILVSP